MAFCTKCGTNVPEGENFCPNCGAPVAPAGNTYNQQTAYVNPSDHTEEFSGEDINRTKYLAALGYISVIFSIIGLLSEPQSKFIRFHLNQVLVLNVFAVLCTVVCIVPILGWIVGGVGSIMALVFLIMGIVRSCKGKAVELPIIGKYTILHWK